ncbi:hypothetical protein PDIG_20170 [Penicillium digitatum PHI26]|uniref:Zn(2)-C6 fungal-type domain-containing protein n=3 Tax=Penicillium digitatum TaxID=36651 RepID=K9GU45_PEND2|nr:hypothetical protein PDIP_00450 [Penicillium digitatum Pd1]EKV16646.1 hypothetical protein PDIG_20170 [Penicillium digitatum PHI26]EKV22046.1 hypothetical protein PDIP_00450 [Penicillium digitatum Pd1]
MKTSRNIPTSPALTSDPNPAPPFRSVSACNRCRLRKHRCDQRLPRCESCEKAQVRCVGYDPLTKQEVPRSYVAFLESRVKYLNQVLIDHGIGFKPATAYDEEEALKMETGHSPRLEAGPRETRELPEQSETQTGMGARTARKRKWTPSSEDTIPTRQAKRLAQLNVLLTELLTDGCDHRHCSRDPGGGYLRAARRQRVQEDSREQRLPWSPRSVDSIEQDNRVTRSASPGSLHEPYHYPRATPGRGSSMIGGETMRADHGREVRDAKRQPRVELDLVNFESEIMPLAGGGKVRNANVVRHLNVSSRASSPDDEGRSSPEPKFDIAADLLRGRRERERANYDLLDEFLVDWTE